MAIGKLISHRQDDTETQHIETIHQLSQGKSSGSSLAKYWPVIFDLSNLAPQVTIVTATIQILVT